MRFGSLVLLQTRMRVGDSEWPFLIGQELACLLEERQTR